MISFIVSYKNCLIDRKKIALEFFEEMSVHSKNNHGLELIVSDYGSIDNIKEVIHSYQEKDYPFKYIYTEPNEGQYLSLPKCYNNAIQYTKNDIIFPVGIDWRISQEAIDYIVSIFSQSREIVLKISCVWLKKDNKGIDAVLYATVALKNSIIAVRGWDERMHGWGQEDNDLIDRIIKIRGALEIKQEKHLMHHRWHENTLYTRGGGYERNMENIKLRRENLITNGKNMINSYW